MRVYVAGAITPTGDKNHAIEYLTNVRKGIRASVELLLAGFYPFCPFIDYAYWFVLEGDEKISIKLIKELSMAWLEASEAVYVLPGYENSEGTIDEIKRAKELGIPVFYDIEQLKKYERLTFASDFFLVP